MVQYRSVYHECHSYLRRCRKKRPAAPGDDEYERVSVSSFSHNRTLETGASTGSFQRAQSSEPESVLHRGGIHFNARGDQPDIWTDNFGDGSATGTSRGEIEVLRC